MRKHSANRPEEPLKLREQAYVGYTNSLLAREILPGQFITQRELVEITGLPLGAIRELIPRLEAEGLIKTVPQRGMQVPQVDLNLVHNAFQFRIFLEQAAVEQFTREASDTLINTLQSRHEDIIERVSQGEEDSVLEDAQATDLALHETIIDHLHNDIISNAYRVNFIKIRLIRQNETRLNSSMVMPAMREHMSIIEALQRRDAQAAVQAMVHHIETARKRAVGI
ncbi:MAG: GntR family transcriptional regulator [Candidatus Competibacteraceae bacterium]|nr:GntR family transcriptional regulator [Candidatus Competibacteraceae bacterium]MCB1815080.1 GntR family transcriptional regulator [Candidatus Competibacteraceae bacterium]